jgi:transposase
MGQVNFTGDFRLDAIRQITERGHSVADVSKRLGVSTHSLYSWIKRYAASPIAAVKDDQAAEIKRLKQELARVTEERGSLKKAAVGSTSQRRMIRRLRKWARSSFLRTPRA